METRALTIHVAPEAAQAYETAAPEIQRQVDIVLSRKLREAMRDLLRSPDTGLTRGERVLSRLRGRASTGMSTDEILHLTRGEP